MHQAIAGYSATVFFQFHLEERCVMHVQIRRRINANNDK